MPSPIYALSKPESGPTTVKYRMISAACDIAEGWVRLDYERLDADGNVIGQDGRRCRIKPEDVKAMKLMTEILDRALSCCRDSGAMPEGVQE